MPGALSLKRRVIALFALFLLLFTAAGGGVIIVDARQSVRAEMDSVLELASLLIEKSLALEARARAPAEHVAALQPLVAARKLRHVQIRLLDRNGLVISETRTSGASDEVPGWFTALVGVQPVIRRVEILPAAGGAAASYAIMAEPWDEVAEVWETVKALAACMAALSAGTLLMLALAADRALRPLRLFERELARMERGDFGVRLDRPGVPELVPIAAGIQALGDSLARTQSENRRLAAQLVEVEDRERRELAREIHDELGPSLFSLKIDVRELHRLAHDPAAAKPGQIDARAEAAMEAIEAIHQLSRRVLGRLRPAVLDHLPLSEVLHDEIARWRRQASGTRWRLDLDGPLDDLSDPIRLTVYRVVQESVMNAARHAGATEVAVSVERRAGHGGDHVVVSVRDDGLGAPASPSSGGFGISGMSERVHALAGTLTVQPSPDGGTLVHAVIPAGAPMDARSGTRVET